MLKISKLETQLYEHKIMRDAETISVEKFSGLNKKIILEKADICRIKISGNDENLVTALNNLNFPYEIQNIIIRNKLRVPELDKIENKTFYYKEVIDEYNSDFQKVLIDVVEHKTWVEYESDLTKNLFTKTKRKEVAKKYYSGFTSERDSNNFTGLLYKDDEPIGFFMGVFNDETFWGTYFGIINKYRSLNYSKYMYYFMFEVCKQRQVNYFETDVNVSNFQSLKSAYSKGFKPINIKFNVNVFSFYTLEKKEKELLDYKKISDLNALIVYLEEIYFSYDLVNIKKKIIHKDKVNQLVKIPIYNSDQNVMLVFHYLRDDRICYSYYINLMLKK